MSEEEKERAYEFLKELDSYGKTYTADGRAIYIKEHVFNVIDKLQKENQELKEKIKEYEIGKEQE